MCIRDSGHVGHFTFEDQFAESVLFTDMYSSFQYVDLRKSAADCVEPTGKYLTPYFSQLTLFVENPEDMEQVIERAKQLSFYNEDYYNTSIDTDAYEASAKPLRQIQTVMIVLIIVSAIACVVDVYKRQHRGLFFKIDVESIRITGGERVAFYLVEGVGRRTGNGI